ncbi:MAG: hypothetical protein AMXMBFR84_23710 [Candidatus Hydrogenedentota bacterium]
MRRANWIVLLAVVALTGCAKELSAFVLVPDPTGKVGEATITNKTGTAVLAKDRDSTWVKNSETSFTEVLPMPEEQVETLFYQGIQAQPDPPRSFLLYFEEGSTSLNAASQPLVAEIMREVAARNSRDLSVIGHADRKGEDAFNIELSLQRARFIKEALVSSGVRPGDILVESHGENNPLVPTEDGVAEPLNRRVEVVVR